MMNAQKLHSVISPVLCAPMKIMINFSISFVVPAPFGPTVTARKLYSVLCKGWIN